jgi:CRP/FNR family cyclic AMP-dependent transcriptional regulator
MKPVQGSASLPLTGDELWLARLRRSVPASIRRFPAGHVLAGPGEAPAAVHVLMAGAIALEATSRAGKRAMLALLGPGDVVGLESLGRPGSGLDGVRVRAMVACITLALPLFELAEALGHDPSLWPWLAGSLAGRVQALERALVRSLSLPVRDRVWDLLRELASAHGRKVPGGLEIPIPLCQDDLGALVGATRESVNRALNRLRRSGRVSRKDGLYVLSVLSAADQPGERGFS